MSALHNDLATWAGKARARGLETIEIDIETAFELSEALMELVALRKQVKPPARPAIQNLTLSNPMKGV